MLRRLRNNWRRRLAPLLLPAAAFSFSILALSTVPTSYNSAIAAPIPTPTPGSLTLLSAPAPDPVQFDFAQQQTLKHDQLNSNFYGLWYQFSTLIGYLNATGAGAYACGPCVTSLTAGTGISTTLGSQAAGAGLTATIGLSHGDYVDKVNASAPIVVSGTTEPTISCPTCQTGTKVKLAIGLGFAQGAVSTGAVFPVQPIVAYSGGQLTGLRAACGTVDNGSTVVQLSKNGTAIGSLTLSTGTTSSSTFAAVSIGAGDYLTFAITSAGTAQNCGFVAEGWQNVQ